VTDLLGEHHKKSLVSAGEIVEVGLGMRKIAINRASSLSFGFKILVHFSASVKP
jgi:hypothetical protein